MCSLSLFGFFSEIATTDVPVDGHGMIWNVSKEYLIALLQVIVSILIWSASFVATKFSYDVFTPLVLCFIRFLAASMILYFLQRTRNHGKQLPPEDRRAVMLSGLCGVTIYYSFENVGLSLTSAANASVITAVYPIMTILLGVLVFHERVPLRQLFGIIIAVFGIIVVTYTNVEGETSSLLGNLLLIANGFNWGMYNYEVQKVSQKTDSLTLTCYQTLYGTLFLLPALVLEAPFQVGILTTRAILSILFLIFGCSIGAYFLYNEGLRHISAISAASVLNLMPVFGLFFSATILKEAITMRQIIGCIAVMAGVMLSAYVKK